MEYSVLPGLYAVGNPDPTSPVLATANYKLSFDHLRSAAAGLDAWILVLDTDGINVWCAAGKGTFGTSELVRRIREVDLGKVVVHRRVIVPQLGAPGIAAHEVARLSGFEVVWGPVLAEDLPEFLASGAIATPEMRRRRFPLRDRMAVIPIELVASFKIALPVVAAMLVPAWFSDARGFSSGLFDLGVTGVTILLAAILAGAVVTPTLLPWVPGRAFAFKGVVVGLPLVGSALWWRRSFSPGEGWAIEAGGWLLAGVAVAAFFAMNFTGSSTYTSLSGVKREMRIAVPAEIAAITIGVGLVCASKWFAP